MRYPCPFFAAEMLGGAGGFAVEVEERTDQAAPRDASHLIVGDIQGFHGGYEESDLAPLSPIRR